MTSKARPRSMSDSLPEVVDTPPPYTLIAESGSSVVQDDGRIDVDLDSPAARTALKFIPKPSEDDFISPPAYSGPVRCDIKLNIVIHVVGSRGDVQPFIALGNELQKHGHRVRLATHDVFDSFVRESGLEFYPIGGDPAELMAFMVKNPGLIPSMKSLKAGEITRKRVMVREMLEGCWRSCIQDDPTTQAPFVADAIIANPPSFAHVHCAQALGVPLHLMFTMPWSSTSEYPHPLANLKYSGTNASFANAVSYGVVEWMTWQGLGDVINNWRETIDLERVPVTEGPNLVQTLKVPFTYCWSPALVPKPKDWPSYIDVCGFFFRELPIYSPSYELGTFLRNGPPPIYIGFGSIVIDDPPRLTAILEEAVRAVGVRAIISRGWSKLGGSSSKDIMYLGDCPHEWLFQQVSAVVHHGGAGTTACGLRFGKPTTIVPFFGDQPFWGRMIAASGAGAEPIPQKSLTAENLAEAIRYCLTPQARAAAEDIAIRMQSESGVKMAVESFHRNLPLDRMRCQILPDQPASWVYKKSAKPIYLSKLAGQILLDHMRIEPRSLQQHEIRPIVIINRRYDPITSTTSATIGYGTDMLKATSDMFIKPYQEIKGRERSTASSPAARDVEGLLSRVDSQTTTASGKSKMDWDATGAAIGASATGFGKFMKYMYKGMLVDIPLATTEGLRAVPRLYGEEVEDYAIRDWKSGAIAGGKNFGQGMFEGLTDIFTQTHKGAKEEGAMGMAKGFLKGTVSISTKVPSAAIGLVAYPAQGISKSLHTVIKSKTRKQIVKARLQEGQYMARKVPRPEVDPALVMQIFDTLKNPNTY
ncbi:hypothetical protein ETB97_004690 [Aspergillus alliaceus]|uniref:Glycosyltransferase family 28 N-terminal domain-containing protein n=1 Tax=Petromyces alliaceus TaxID=209559 RepID=A0A8H5ZWH2_PETAA|nr:hypothetical protein ETB97_004690 [Aspergillus burnettii]